MQTNYSNSPGELGTRLDGIQFEKALWERPESIQAQHEEFIIYISDRDQSRLVNQTLAP